MVPAAGRTSLALYDAMCSAIEAAYQVDEVADIRNRALAMATYARLAQNREAEEQAQQIRKRAERKAGELLAAMEKAKGAMGSGSNQHEVRSGRSTAPTLSDLGITKDQSSNWQKLAQVPAEDFEREIAAGTSTESIIAHHVIRQQPEPHTDRIDAKALWFWGCMRDFDREGVLEADPNDLLTTMFDHQKTTTLAMVPRLAAWLRRFPV